MNATVTIHYEVYHDSCVVIINSVTTLGSCQADPTDILQKYWLRPSSKCRVALTKEAHEALNTPSQTLRD